MTDPAKPLAGQWQNSGHYGDSVQMRPSPNLVRIAGAKYDNYQSMPTLGALTRSSGTPAAPPPADVKFKHLPFYDVLDELVRPCAMCKRLLFV